MDRAAAADSQWGPISDGTIEFNDGKVRRIRAERIEFMGDNTGATIDVVFRHNAWIFVGRIIGKTEDDGGSRAVSIALNTVSRGRKEIRPHEKPRAKPCRRL